MLLSGADNYLYRNLKTGIPINDNMLKELICNRQPLCQSDK